MSTPLSPKSRRNASRFPVRSRRLSTTPLCDLKSSPLSLNPKSIPSESVWNDDLWAIDATRRLISDLTSILRSRFALIYFIKWSSFIKCVCLGMFLNRFEDLTNSIYQLSLRILLVPKRRAIPNWSDFTGKLVIQGERSQQMLPVGRLVLKLYLMYTSLLMMFFLHIHVISSLYWLWLCVVLK